MCAYALELCIVLLINKVPEKNINNNKYASTNHMISTGNKINPILHASEKFIQ